MDTSIFNCQPLNWCQCNRSHQGQSCLENKTNTKLGASFYFWQTNSRLMFCTFWNWVETLGQQRVIDIFAHSSAAKDLLCVFRNWGCRKFFHRKDTFVCFFLTGGPLVTNNSWLRMITVSEIVRICQTSNYLLDINWPPSRTCKTQWSENNDNDSYS